MLHSQRILTKYSRIVTRQSQLDLKSSPRSSTHGLPVIPCPCLSSPLPFQTRRAVDQQEEFQSCALTLEGQQDCLLSATTDKIQGEHACRGHCTGLQSCPEAMQKISSAYQPRATIGTRPSSPLPASHKVPSHRGLMSIAGLIITPRRSFLILRQYTREHFLNYVNTKLLISSRSSPHRPKNSFCKATVSS